MVTLESGMVTGRKHHYHKPRGAQQYFNIPQDFVVTSLEYEIKMQPYYESIIIRNFGEYIYIYIYIHHYLSLSLSLSHTHTLTHTHSHTHSHTHTHTHIYIYIYINMMRIIYVYTYIYIYNASTTSWMSRMWHKVNFKWCLMVLKSEFSFYQTCYYTKAKETSLLCYLLIAGGRWVGFMPFQRVLALCGMQKTLSWIGTFRPTLTITPWAPPIYIYIYIYIYIFICVCVCVCVCVC